MENWITRTMPSINALPPTYLSLLNQSAAQSFYFSFPWFRNFASTALDRDDQVRLYGIEDSATSESLAMLIARYHQRPKGFLSARKLSSLSNYYSSLFAPALSQTADQAAVLRKLAEFVCHDTLQWDVLELRPLERESAFFDDLVTAFRSAGRLVQPFFCFGNWYLKTSGLSFKEYFSGLPSMLRNTVTRKGKKLEKSGRTRLVIITGTDLVEEGVCAYEQVYTSSWKIPEPYPNFTSGLIRTAAEAGWLRLGVVYLDDKPIASQLWIVSGGKCTIFKLAYDERFSEYSAGSVLTAKLMEHVLDVDKVDEVDFGSGDDKYKKSWLPQRRERWGLLTFNPRTVSGMLRAARHLGGHAAKSLVKRIVQKSRRPPLAVEGPQTSPTALNDNLAAGGN